MRLTALSGLGVKGPACFLLEVADRRLLLDLGRGPDEDRLPDVTGLGDVDAILISHGHMDHTGGLDLAQRLGNPPVFASSATIALGGERLALAKPYDDLSQICGIDFCYGPAGHAPGACWMRLAGQGGLLYGGDSSCESSLWRFCLPPKAKVAIFDCSYGLSDESLIEQRHRLLALADRPILLPCPAGGRGLEMALDFMDLGLEVSLCEAHHQVAREMVGRDQWLARKGIERLLHLPILTQDSRAFGVMIGAGPNAERGVTAHLVPRFLRENSAHVIFSGHLAKGTPSTDLVEKGQAHFMRWNVHPNFTGLQELIAAANPDHIMAAFCSFDQITDLGEKLRRPFIKTREFVW